MRANEVCPLILQISHAQTFFVTCAYSSAPLFTAEEYYIRRIKDYPRLSVQLKDLNLQVPPFLVAMAP